MLNLYRANLSIEPLNVAINALVEQASQRAHAGDQPRSYLGASLIGDDCARKVQFEWMVSGTVIPARVRSIFTRGHVFQAESRAQLIAAGFIFASSDNLAFTALDGLIAGHADGIILHAPQALEPSLTIPAVWEHKALNAKNFRAVERDGLAKVFPRYAAQVALYQNFLNVTNPALVTLANADTSERLHFVVPFNPVLAQEASDRAVDIVRATMAGELLASLDPDHEDFRCRMCSHLERCRRHAR